MPKMQYTLGMAMIMMVTGSELSFLATVGPEVEAEGLVEDLEVEEEEDHQLEDHSIEFVSQV